jgi:hypothetical protein
MFNQQSNANRGPPLSSSRLQNGKLGTRIWKDAEVVYTLSRIQETARRGLAWAREVRPASQILSREAAQASRHLRRR